MLISKLTSCFVWITAVCGAPILFGQSAADNRLSAHGSIKAAYTPHLTFDVASIREERNSDGSYIDNAPKSSVYIAYGVTAEGLILGAYDVKIRCLLKGVPDWAMATRYNVSAKSDSATDEALAKLNIDDFLAEKRHMLQILLADRFSLRIHPETTLSRTYELIATERAAKLMTPVYGDIRTTISTCAPHADPHKGMEFNSKGCPFAFLVGNMRQDLGTDVVDRTEMTGPYAYHLMYRPSQVTPRDNEEWYPDIVHAVREQLGLELKKAEGPVSSWVVDHVEHPTPD
jgi:uncharacterized protein (TIGR03435 family)